MFLIPEFAAGEVLNPTRRSGASLRYAPGAALLQEDFAMLGLKEPMVLKNCRNFRVATMHETPA